MPRASYIYLVIDPDKWHKPVAAFTVKYELGDWWKRQENTESLQVWRLRDCGNPVEPGLTRLPTEGFNDA